MRSGVIGLGAIGLAVAGSLTLAMLHRETRARGFDEIAYTQLHSQLVLPGQSVSQKVRVQGPGLSQVDFLYSSTSPEPAPADVAVQAGGKLIAHEHPLLQPTLSMGDREAWWSFQAVGDAAPNTWQALARFQEIQVPGGPRGTLLVTVAVPPGGRGLLLYWDPAGSAAHAQETQSRRYAVRTEYGPNMPALFKLATFLQRLASLGSPWLPAPALLVLTALTLALLSHLCWQLAAKPD